MSGLRFSLCGCSFCTSLFGHQEGFKATCEVPRRLIYPETDSATYDMQKIGLQGFSGWCLSRVHILHVQGKPQ